MEQQTKIPNVEHQSTANSDEHHVRFDASILKQAYELDNTVSYKRNEHKITANIGFLKVEHKYLVDLELPCYLFTDEEHAIILKNLDKDFLKPVNETTHILDFSGRKKGEKYDYYSLKVRFLSRERKNLQEVLVVDCLNYGEDIKTIIVISASVLGEGKGTPLLRNGVHCIGFNNYHKESEQDDGKNATTDDDA